MKYSRPAIILALLAGASYAQPFVYTISTAVGGSSAITFADGKPATSFLIPTFWTPAIDKQGNFYFSLDQRVIKVGPDGTATTYAGTGEAGYNGDGIPATTAQLNTPGTVLLDPQGRLLIFDTYRPGSNRIRRVEADGTISTIAGTGVIPTTPNDSDGLPATRAKVHASLGAFDKTGNLFILDHDDMINNFNIRRIDTNGYITTVAFNVGIFPTGMATDGTNIFLADVNGGVNRVAKLTSAGNLVTLAGGVPLGFGGDGGPSVSALVSGPGGLAVDSSGNVTFADSGNQRIRTIHNSAAAPAASGQGIISTSAGTGTAGFGADGASASTSLVSNPYYLASDAQDNFYYSDSGSGRYRQFKLNGAIQTVAGLSFSDPLGDGGPANQASLIAPTGLFFDTAGNLLLDDSGRIRMVSIADGTISTIAGQGTLGSSGDRGGPALEALLQYPSGAVRDSFGNTFVLDGSILRKVAQDGTITRISGFAGATKDQGAAADVNLGAGQTLAIDAQDNVYIASYLSVRKLTGSVITRIFGTNAYTPSPLASGPALSAAVFSLYGIAVDNATGNLAVDDWANHRILKVTPDGQFSTMAGSYGKADYQGDGGAAAQALLNHPTGGAFDAWSNFYFFDTGNHVIRKIASDGTISTIAGSANAGFSGDGGPASSAVLNAANSIGVAADAAGNVMFVDGNRIRQLMPDKLRANGVLHSATLTAGPVVAGLRIFIQGPELIPPGASSDAVQVLFDGQPASSTTNDGSQIVAVVPAAVAGESTTQVQIRVGAALTNALPLPVVAALPGIVSIQNADGTANGDTSPAAPGSAVVLLETGDGNADPSTMSVQIGGGPATILDVSPSPAIPGVQLITVQLPDGTPDGSAVTFAVGDAVSPAVALRVQPGSRVQTRSLPGIVRDVRAKK